MDMTLNFLIQATRVLSVGNYDDNELEMVYNFLTTIDNESLNSYLMTSTIISYNSDLELYVEIVDICIEIYEEREEYEKCQVLKNKKEYAIKLIKKK